MWNACYNYARMSTRPPFPPPTHPPFTGNPYPFTPFSPCERHPAQMMPGQGYPVYGPPQMSPPPVWPYQHANGYYYYIDGFPSPFPSKVELPKAPRYDEYFKPPPKAPRDDEYYKPPPRANPPMISGGSYGDGFYPPRHDPPGGNPVNVHVNLHMGPQDLQAPKHNANSNDNASSNDNANSNHNTNTNDNSQAGPPGWRQYNPQVQGVNYNPNGNYDSPTGWHQYNPQVQGGNYNPNGYYNIQTGGGQYNPQVQGGNKVGDGKITLGPEISNINMRGGKAGGDQTSGGNYNANSNYNA